ncbi:DUF5748 family protein [Thermococcus celer]|uniref:Uncharacterized protein n=1 Tax=Thermococcus celer Vu 13 = JCM 8558 TaxID=1293037 RepID=A0A218P3M2_THECE|nr:DUF5748 family protein [Thermococcus celer]ASI99516.1 hypothetical protein A3L02_08060 [Thermococcus celer Vu 13 = JCM 8558]
MNFEVVKEFLEEIGADWVEIDDEIHLDPEVFYEVWRYVGRPDLETYTVEEEVVEPGSYDPPEKKYVSTKKIRVKKAYFTTLDNRRVVTNYNDLQRILKEKSP